MSKKQVWEQPAALQQMLSDASFTNPTNSDARLTLCNDELGTLTLTGASATYVLSSVETLEQFFDAIDQANDCDVEVSGIELEPDVQEKLEGLFSYVEVV